MKKLFVLAVLMIGLIQSYGQNSIENKKGLTMITAGLGVANGKIDGNDAKGRLSINAGLEQVFLIGKKLIFVVKPVLDKRGYKSGSFNVNVWYLEVPTGLEYIFNPDGAGFFIGGGAQPGMAVTGSYSGKAFKFGESKDDNRSRTDFGYYVSIGTYKFALGKWTLAYYWGTKNVIPSDRQTGTNSVRLFNLSSNLSIPLSAFGKHK